MFDLKAFKTELKKQVKNKELSYKTANYYLNCLEKINELISVHCNLKSKNSGFGKSSSPSERRETLSKIIDKLCTGNNQTLKYIAAVKKYERDIMHEPKALLYGEGLAALYRNSREPGKGKQPALPEDKFIRKINRLNNETLKLAFRLEHQSGLRISEIADLKKEDITFNESTRTIKLNVRNGKGRKSRSVDVVQDAYLYDRLNKFIKDKPEGTAVFYSESYLKKKAGEYGIETHDLRRVNARQRFRTERSAGNGRRDARRTVADQLGHNDPKTTNLYLGEEW